jgi:hypothetical protein
VAVLLKNYATSGACILFILRPRNSELDIELILVLLNFSCEFSSFSYTSLFLNKRGHCTGHSHSPNAYLLIQYATHCHGELNVKKSNFVRETGTGSAFSKVRQ